MFYFLATDLQLPSPHNGKLDIFCHQFSQLSVGTFRFVAFLDASAVTCLKGNCPTIANCEPSNPAATFLLTIMLAESLNVAAQPRVSRVEFRLWHCVSRAEKNYDRNDRRTHLKEKGSIERTRGRGDAKSIERFKRRWGLKVDLEMNLRCGCKEIRRLLCRRLPLQNPPHSPSNRTVAVRTRHYTWTMFQHLIAVSEILGDPGLVVL